MAELYFRQNDFSGGLADSDIIGIESSYAESVGLDIHSIPRVLKVNQKLTKNSGDTGATKVNDFCKYSINSSDGNTYWFGDTGYIYKRTSAGVWSTVYDDVEILGALEFNGYFYWATATKLHEMIITGNWTTDVDSVATWPKTLDTASFHPMIQQGLYLFIGNNRKIASVDDIGTFTSQGTPDVTLDLLPITYSIKCLARFGIDLLVGTYNVSNNQICVINRWDCASPSYISYDDIPELSINAFMPVENIMFAQCGTAGNIYYYDGSELNLYKTIKGDYLNKMMTVHSGSPRTFGGLSMFGVSNVSSNPCLLGVYSLGHHDKNYPIVINLEYVISQNKTSSIEVGAMNTVNQYLFVAWKDGTTYGVDVIDYANKYSGAYFKTLAIGGNRNLRKDFTEFFLAYKSKPANTDFTLYYDKNYAGTFADAITLIDETDYNKLRSQQTVEAGTIALKVAFTVSGNLSSELEELGLIFDEKTLL